ncbi:MAG: UvrD-helicase domain-containing protein [Cytophagales bacterium]|nr:UvrD-helicase domain-containing protein [Cytophagales bacterium]
MSLTIYKSSAGSGKTYTLAKEYLKLALRSETYYQNILAVTFTNRAAQEMKKRVLEFLIDISKGKHEFLAVYAEEMSITEAEVQKRAKKTLTHLLHHYGFFSISTIDTFFHRVIRAFSREIGLQGSFGIELDTDKVAEYIASDIFTDIEDPQLKEWLIDFAGSKLGEGEGYEIRGELGALAQQLFKEDFKGLHQEQFEDEQAKEKLKVLKGQLIKTVNLFESALQAISSRFETALSESGLNDDAIKNGKNLHNFFRKLARIHELSGKDYSEIVGKQVTAASNDPSTWAKADKTYKDQVEQWAISSFMPLMNEAINYMSTNEASYFTAKAATEHLYTLGLLSDLARRLQEYKKEEEVIMISDLPDFLSQIIDDSGSPFIYEKVGSRYKHFLMDEFQDTSKLQWRNFKPLLEESLSNGHESIVVGDAKQSIYSWRGGDPSLLLSGIQEDFPQAEWKAGEVNYRSAKNVVAFNNALFSEGPKLMAEMMSDTINPDGISSFLGTYEGAEQSIFKKNENVEGLVQVEFLEFERGEYFKEVAMTRTIDVIEGLLKDGHDMNDIALLVRTNREAADLVNFVFDYKRDHTTSIEVISDDGMLLKNSPVVQLLLAAFGHLVYPKDKTILSDLVFKYQETVEDHSFTTHDDFLTLTEEHLPEGFRKHKPHLLHLPIFEMTEVLIRCFGLQRIESEFAYLQAFQDAVLEYSKNQRSDLRLFLEWWEDAENKRSVKLTGALGAVEIITSHKSKGLQYPIVIVPFCNFKMDSLSHTSWYDSPDEEGFDEIKALPIDYKSELEKSNFSTPYKDELAKWHLESLNVLYVAFTRAERGLYTFCEPPPKEKKKMYGTVSKLIWTFFEHTGYDEWNEAAGIYKKGHLDVLKAEQTDDLIQLSGYNSNKWSKKLSIRKTGKAYYDDEVEKQRNEGILLHQILSEITHWGMTDKVLEKYEARNEISKEDKDRYGKLIHNLWENDEIKDWFSSDYEVKTEVVVLPKDGETKRMDRVILRNKEAKVIDFKNGRPKNGDEMQVREYVELLKGMGYETRGYLLYLKGAEVKAI